MSRQKNTELPETEKAEVTEKLIEQSEIEKPVLSPKVNKVATASVKANKRMNVTRFLSYYPQDVYMETLLKFYYPKSLYTVDEWFQRIEDIWNIQFK